MPALSLYGAVLTDRDREELTTEARRYSSPYWVVIRAKIVLQ